MTCHHDEPSELGSKTNPSFLKPLVTGMRQVIDTVGKCNLHDPYITLRFLDYRMQPE